MPVAEASALVRHGENGIVAEPDDVRGAARWLDHLARDREWLGRLRCGRAGDRRRVAVAGDAAVDDWPAALERLVAEPPPDDARWPVRLMADAMAGVAVYRNDHFVLRRRAQAHRRTTRPTRPRRRCATGCRPRRGSPGCAGWRRPPPAPRASGWGERRCGSRSSAQGTYFSSCALSSPAGGLEPIFVDHRGGADADALRRRLADAAPEVVVVFRPEIVAPGLFDDLDALTLGFSTEPLPRDAAAHPDQLVRLGELAQADPGQFDRIVTFDPLSAAAAAGHLPVWRSLPLPVDDRFYAPVRRLAPPAARPSSWATSTEHRERFLIDAKHEFDLLHVACGLHGDALRELFARTDVALNVHAQRLPELREPRPAAPGRRPSALISEPLSPHHGLRPGVDLLEARTPDELRRAIRSVRAVAASATTRSAAQGAAAPSASARRACGRG